MRKVVTGLLLSLTFGAAHGAYEPREFDVKKNYVVSNPNRGEDGRNFFLNFVQTVRNKAVEIKNNVRDNINAGGIGKGIGGGSSGGGIGGGGGGGGGIGGGGGGGVCR
jgi:hypothetical protein